MGLFIRFGYLKKRWRGKGLDEWLICKVEFLGKQLQSQR